MLKGTHLMSRGLVFIVIRNRHARQRAQCQRLQMQKEELMHRNSLLDHVPCLWRPQLLRKCCEVCMRPVLN